LRRPAPTDRSSRPEDAFRGFLAVLLPEEVRAEAARVAAPLRGLGDAKWVAPENYHLTLKFLGQVPRDRVPDLGGALLAAAAAQQPFRLALSSLGAFPSPSRPQTVWIGVEEGREALAALAAAVEAACEAHGFAREARPFHAHLTLGRVQSPKGRETLAGALREGMVPGAQCPVPGRDRPSGAPGTGHRAPPAGHRALGTGHPVVITAIHLMKSRLLPGGPIYSIEETFPLGGERA